MFHVNKNLNFNSRRRLRPRQLHPRGSRERLETLQGQGRLGRQQVREPVSLIPDHRADPSPRSLQLQPADHGQVGVGGGAERPQTSHPPEECGR